MGIDSLDLALHDPEEYEGKRVRLNGADYVLGAHLGTGAERITHLLVNAESGLALLVLKIRRDDLPKGVVSGAFAQLRASPELARMIPVIVDVDLPGGRAEIQEYVGGGPAPPDPAGEAVDEALAALLAGEHARAVALHEAVLASHPAHTMALVNLAASCDALGDPGRAAGLCGEAVRIEPNMHFYRRALVRYRARTGALRHAVDDFLDAREIFTDVFDLHEQAVDLLLVCGDIEQARRLADEAVLDDETRRALEARIAQASDAARSADAPLSRAKHLVAQGDDRAALEALHHAAAAWSASPIVAINLALAEARCSDARAAAVRLTEVSLRVDFTWSLVCTANAAFALARGGLHREALPLLRILARMLPLQHGGQLPADPADLPGVARWVEPDQWTEEPLASAASLVHDVLAGLDPGCPAPDDVQELALAYRRACAGS